MRKALLGFGYDRNELLMRDVYQDGVDAVTKKLGIPELSLYKLVKSVSPSLTRKQWGEMQ